MYIRYTVARQDERSGSAEGLFTVAYRELGSGAMTDCEHEWLEELLAWFKKKVKIPGAVLRKIKMVGAVRFELTTSCTPSKRAYQATLRPDRALSGESDGSGIIGARGSISTPFSHRTTRPFHRRPGPGGLRA